LDDSYAGNMPRNYVTLFTQQSTTKIKKVNYSSLGLDQVKLHKNLPINLMLIQNLVLRMMEVLQGMYWVSIRV